ncbi:major facilitator superfamily domain-containing protein [Diplogelasinospora grovesii]|uniref:Major facilitator superfamily domain-containing protein n=1 Tax=Diplogelasinospora grovesii TaxID=303347 RepID=A0AAN6MWN9_9PEZI|nr:major facilitator superfamily domain-containing protein [Diplogelasinospora grovesii]
MSHVSLASFQLSAAYWRVSPQLTGRFGCSVRNPELLRDRTDRVDGAALSDSELTFQSQTQTPTEGEVYIELGQHRFNGSNASENNGGPDSAESPVEPESGFNVATIEDIPPDGGYGWICTVCVFMINANTWGVNACWAIFLDRYLTFGIYPGATKLQYAMIGGLSISQALLISPLVTVFQKWIGTRYTMLLGAAIIWTALFSASAATQIWQLFMSMAFCFGWGMGLIYIPAMALLPPWFSSRRSLAVGLATSGAGLGGLAFSLITGRLIAVSGVAWTYRILSFISLACNAICALLVRERPLSSAAAARSACRVYRFPRDFARTQILLVVCWGFLTEFGYVALWYSLPNYATSIGLDPTQGSIVQSLLSLGLGLGRPVVGYYSDKVGRINIALGMTLLCGILCLTLWILARSYVGLLIFAASAGVVSGTFWSTVSPILAEVVGIAEAGSTFGAICFALVLPTTFAEGIAMQLVKGEQGSQQFLDSQIFVGCMFVAGAVSLWLLRSWKIYEIESKAADEQQLQDQHPTAVFGLATMSTTASASARGGPSSAAARIAWLTPRRLFMPRRV